MTQFFSYIHSIWGRDKDNIILMQEMEKPRLREGVSTKSQWAWGGPGTGGQASGSLRTDSLPRRPTYKSKHTLRLPHGSAAPEEAHGHHQGPCSNQHIEPCREEVQGDADHSEPHAPGAPAPPQVSRRQSIQLLTVTGVTLVKRLVSASDAWQPVLGS